MQLTLQGQFLGAADIACWTIYEIWGVEMWSHGWYVSPRAVRFLGLMEPTEEWIWLESRIPSTDSTDRRKRDERKKTIER